MEDPLRGCSLLLGERVPSEAGSLFYDRRWTLSLRVSRHGTRRQLRNLGVR